MSLTIKDIRDFDLMAKLHEGPLLARELASDYGKETGTYVASRLGWMGKWGMLERDPKTAVWRITDAGDRVVKAKQRAALLSTLDELPEEELIEVMAHITARWRRGSGLIATMLRREFIFGTQH
jgi:hypothetical protein